MVTAGLTFGAVAQGHERTEQPIFSSDVPAAVQHAAEAHTKGGAIVRWEREGSDYEAVIDKNGKQMGFTFDANGKLMSRHDENKEKSEKY